MKKKMALMLACLMASAALFSCGKSAESKKEIVEKKKQSRLK